MDELSNFMEDMSKFMEEQFKYMYLDKASMKLDKSWHLVGVALKHIWLKIDPQQEQLPKQRLTPPQHCSQ